MGDSSVTFVGVRVTVKTGIVLPPYSPVALGILLKKGVIVRTVALGVIAAVCDGGTGIGWVDVAVGSDGSVGVSLGMLVELTAVVGGIVGIVWY